MAIVYLKQEHLTVYTDGGCIQNKSLKEIKEKNLKRKGAWAYVIIDKEGRIVEEDSGTVEDTTNSRMELRAFSEALSAGVKLIHSLYVISDSQYIVRAFNEHWLAAWAHNGWKKSNGGQLKNSDLWKNIYLSSHLLTEIRVFHIRGHSGNKWNEYVDGKCSNLLRAGITVDSPMEVSSD